jgi:hypothetical protein
VNFHIFTVNHGYHVVQVAGEGQDRLHNRHNLPFDRASQCGVAIFQMGASGVESGAFLR